MLQLLITSHYMLEEISITFLYLEVGLPMAKNSFYCKGTQIWNSLNASLYATATLRQFKNFYKSYF